MADSLVKVYSIYPWQGKKPDMVFEKIFFGVGRLILREPFRIAMSGIVVKC